MYWRRDTIAVLLALLVVANASCNREEEPNQDSEPAMDSSVPDPTFSQLVKRAREYAEEEHPGMKFDFTLPERVTAYEEYWEATWLLPPDPLLRGGTPTIRLDKESLEVVDAKFGE